MKRICLANNGETILWRSYRRRRPPRSTILHQTLPLITLARTSPTAPLIPSLTDDGTGTSYTIYSFKDAFLFCLISQQFFQRFDSRVIKPMQVWTYSPDLTRNLWSYFMYGDGTNLKSLARKFIKQLQLKHRMMNAYLTALNVQNDDCIFNWSRCSELWLQILYRNLKKYQSAEPIQNLLK